MVTVSEMRDAERRAADIGVPPHVLMEHAGLSIAQHMKAWLGTVVHKQIVVLIGPGNNGGDGLVAARHLHDWGSRVSVYLCAQRHRDDANYIAVQEKRIPSFLAGDDTGLSILSGLLSSADVVVDALFGTGKARPLEGIFEQVLSAVRQTRQMKRGLKVVAVDLPSGLDADTGNADPSSVPADLTVTLGYPKVGLYSFPGRDLVGQLVVGDIGMPEHLAEHIPTELITADYVRGVLPDRPRNAHKGTFGRVLVCAGSLNYVGAAYLACQGAMRVGAGLVTLAVARSLHPILASKLTEITYLLLPDSEPGYINAEASEVLHETLSDYDVLLIGCGLSQHGSVPEFVTRTLFDMPLPLSTQVVLDADALNNLAPNPEWWRSLHFSAILTPHPGEMGRLANLATREVGQDRLGLTRNAAAKWGTMVVLKGAHTVVASPSSEAKIGPHANAGLASAGTGDVLAGALAGLLAQGLSPMDAAACGVYLHGEAAEKVTAQVGDAGMVASDLLPLLPKVIKDIKEG